jgi:hypothetical protein
MVNVPPPAGGYILSGTPTDVAGALAPEGDPWLQPPPGWRPNDAPAAPR